MTINPDGINVPALHQFAQAVAGDASKGNAQFNVKTRWEHQTRSEATVCHYTLGGTTHQRHFEIAADEPTELLGPNSAPNPQNLPMAALNASCQWATLPMPQPWASHFIAWRLELAANWDQRGFLGLDETVNPGYDEIS